MADYAPNFTARVVYKYVSSGSNHSLMLRPRISTETAIDAQQLTLYLVLDALKSLLPNDFKLTEAVLYEAGETVSHPQPISSDLATFTGTSDTDDVYGANFISFQGRSFAGSRVSLNIYGIVAAPATVIGRDFRWQQGESAAVDAAIAMLANDSGNDGIVAIDGTAPLWKQYANYGVSAYWQRRLRG